MSKDNTCIFCNEVIPEGMMVCPVCEEALTKVSKNSPSSTGGR